MKTKNTHGVYDHTSPHDQKALFISRVLALLVMLGALIALLFVGLYFKQLNDQDKRTEYIEQYHSELK